MDLYPEVSVGDLLALGALVALPVWHLVLGWLLRPSPKVTAGPRVSYGGPGLRSWGSGTTES